MPRRSHRSACAICLQPLQRWGPAGCTCDKLNCRHAYQRLLASRSICCVCGRPLPRTAVHRGATAGPADPGPALCGELDCQVQLGQWQRQLGAENLVQCDCCGRVLLPGQAARGLCADRDCLVLQRAAQGRAAQIARDEAYAALVQAASQLRDQQAAAAGRNAADFRPVVVPRFAAELVPCDPLRIQNLKVWLQSIVPAGEPTTAADSGQAAAPRSVCEPPDETAIDRLGCRLCRGACCRNGGDSAYLDRPTLERALQAGLAPSGDELLAEYLAYVPPQSFEHSCIYHGETGCTLPRHLRADICNQFLCSGLRQARELVRRDGVRRLYLISAAGVSLDRGEFLDLDDSAPD